MRRKNIVFRVPGGLGNQLFSYFCSLYVSQQIDSIVTLDFSSVDRSHFIGHVPLSSVRFQENRIRVKNLHEPSRRHSNLLNSVSSPLKHKIGIFRREVFDPGRDSINEMDRFLQSRKGSCITPITIEGYFGDFAYYDALIPELQEISLVNPSPQYLALVEEITNSNFAAVHHRLGDFVELSKSVGLLGAEYYRESIQSVRNLGSARILVFSNDVGLSKSIFLKWGIDLQDIEWVDTEILKDPLENLLLMSKFWALICSNSTFSFWGAKLAKENCKAVIYPSEFRRDRFTKVENVPSFWTAVEPHWLVD